MLLKRRAVLGLLASAVAQAAAAELAVSPVPLLRPEGLAKRRGSGTEALVAAAGLSGKVSFALVDLESGEMLETHNPLLRMPPASVAKSVTALYALDTLGDSFRFVTGVYATGPIEEGRIQGDLVLRGSGDPTLDTDMLAGLAADLLAAGVTGVTGKFLVYGGALPHIHEVDTTQTEYAGYNPSISGLNLNYNRVHFEWKRSGEAYDLKMEARAARFAPDVDVARIRISERNAPVFDHESGDGVDLWSVARSALGSSGARWLPVRLPELYAGEAFQAVAGAQGLTLPKPEVVDDMPAAFLIAKNESAPLTVIVKSMLKYSTNLTAEVLGLTASIKRGAEINGLADSAAEMSAWAAERFDTRHLAFVDHSGLGADSDITGSDMVRILSADGVQAQLQPLLKPFAMPEVNRTRGVDAKTGTLNFVSTLAGYVTTQDGRTLAFGIFTGDEERRSAAQETGAERPEGSRPFIARAKTLQRSLLNRWGEYYSGYKPT